MDHIIDSNQLVIEIKTSTGVKIIQLNHILFVHAKRKLSILYMDDDTSIITFHMLNWFEKHLLPSRFFRCHNSYLVNYLQVECYNRTKITFKNKKCIPLSRNFRGPFIEKLKQFQSKQALDSNKRFHV